MVYAARQHLLDSGVLTDLVDNPDPDVPRDPEKIIGADLQWPNGWVFAGDTEGRPYRVVEGTGKVCIVLFCNGPWSSPSRNHTTEFPLLRVNIYADPDRDENSAPTKHNAEDKIDQVYKLIKPLFHDAANVVHKFDIMPIISTVGGSALTLLEIPEGDGSVVGAATYEITL